MKDNCASSLKRCHINVRGLLIHFVFDNKGWGLGQPYRGNPGGPRSAPALTRMIHRLHTGIFLANWPLNPWLLLSAPHRCGVGYSSSRRFNRHTDQHIRGAQVVSCLLQPIW